MHVRWELSSRLFAHTLNTATANLLPVVDNVLENGLPGPMTLPVLPPSKLSLLVNGHPWYCSTGSLNEFKQAESRKVFLKRPPPDSSHFNASQIPELTQHITSRRKYGKCCSSVHPLPSTRIKDKNYLLAVYFRCHWHKQHSLPAFSQTWYLVIDGLREWTLHCVPFL